jgi:hypothetical protein
LAKSFHRREDLKKILLILALVCALAIAIPSAAFAADPTTIIVNWNGGGTVTGTTTAGNDAIYNFQTSGSGISGQFNVLDQNDNSYSYGVDYTNSYINADVTNGYIYYEGNRTDSYVPMYGGAGQTVASFVGVGTGTGEMATGSWNNYAEGGTATYAQPHTSGGYNYEASGTNFAIVSYIGIGDANFGTGFSTTSTGNNAYLQSTGTGTAKINDMSNGYWGTGLTFGSGMGCYTNANALLTGTGQFLVNAIGTNSITSGGWNVGGSGTYGSATFSQLANYSGATSVSDYSLTVR